MYVCNNIMKENGFCGKSRSLLLACPIESHAMAWLSGCLGRLDIIRQSHPLTRPSSFTEVKTLSLRTEAELFSSVKVYKTHKISFSRWNWKILSWILSLHTPHVLLHTSLSFSPHKINTGYPNIVRINIKREKGRRRNERIKWTGWAAECKSVSVELF